MSTKSKTVSEPAPLPVPRNKITKELADRLLAEDQQRLVEVSDAIITLMRHQDLVPEKIRQAIDYDLRYLSALGDWVESPDRAARVLPDLLQSRRAAVYKGFEGFFK